MEYGKLIAITGFGGLFELVGSKNDGAIVRGLDETTTKFVSNRQHSFSHLESIEVYTTSDNVNLIDIFRAMEKAGVALPDAKADGKALQAYFGQVYPDMDFERVYNSDMKKMVKWFQIISEKGIAFKLSGETELAVETPAIDETESTPEAAPKKATRKKKSEA